MAGQRVDVQTAAELLGISSDAVRKRAKHGKLPHEIGVDGRLYVWVDDGRTWADTEEEANLYTNVKEVDPRDDFIATLKEQLEAERKAHAETRRIAYTLAQRVPELEAGATPDPRESPLPSSEEPSGQTPSDDAEQPQRS
jgi:hypothetical protein